MFIVCKSFEVAGAHQLALGYESKCSNLHGHNWKIKVWCKAKELNDDGMVIDFVTIKKMVAEKIDHACLNEVLPFNPTAENIARWIANTVPYCFKAEVEESEGNLAIYEAE